MVCKITGGEFSYSFASNGYWVLNLGVYVVRVGTAALNIFFAFLYYVALFVGYCEIVT